MITTAYHRLFAISIKGIMPDVVSLPADLCWRMIRPRHARGIEAAARSPDNPEPCDHPDLAILSEADAQGKILRHPRPERNSGSRRLENSRKRRRSKAPSRIRDILLSGTSGVLVWDDDIVLARVVGSI